MAATNQGILSDTRPSPLAEHPLGRHIRQMWPEYGAFLLFTVTLLLAAFARAIAGLKPGEVILAGLVSALVLRRLFIHDFTWKVTPVDFGFLLIIVTGTVFPFIAAEARGLYITKEMLTALLGPVEYYLWYRVFLEALPMPTRLPQLTRVILVVTTIISAVGVLQIFHFPGVQNFLINYYPTYETIESQFIHRATSLVGGWETLAAIAAYTLILINQIQTTEGAVRKLGTRWNYYLLVMLAINVIALIATLSFAGLLALVIGYGLAWRFNGKLARTTRIALLIGVVGALALSPFIAERYLLQFHNTAAQHSVLPQTWVERGDHWSLVVAAVFVNAPTILFGVQPSFTYPVLDFGSTESLYLLLLYRGGILYVAAFLVFIVLVTRYLWRVRQQAQGFSRQLVTGILTVLLMNFAIDILDAHFFGAGESQLMLTLLAAGVGVGMRTDQRLYAAQAADDLNTNVRIPAISTPLRLTRGVQVGLLLALSGVLVVSGVAVRIDLHGHAPPATLQVAMYNQTAPIPTENRFNHGTPKWELDPGVDTSFIQGYAGKVSAFPGDIVPLYISSQASAQYNIDVYRIGWYSGLSGRLFASVQHQVSQTQGYWTPQTGLQDCPTCQIDPVTHLIDAHWTDSYDLQIGDSWPSGVYLIKLTTLDRAPRAETYIPLVIKAITAKPSTILVDLPVITYEADNLWGGFNLSGTSDNGTSDITSSVRATKVSFDRPYAGGAGTQDFLSYDFHTVRYLERAGMDVSYTTNLDVAEYPDQLTKHAVYLSSGHDEYWTKSMRDGLEAALGQRISLMFLGANDAYWQARLEPDALGYPDRTLVCYKVQTAPSADPTVRLTADPAYPAHNDSVTARWRDPVINRPENTLLGLMYASYFTDAQPGAYKPDWVARQGPLDTLLAETNFTPGEHLHGGLLGNEFDSVADNGLTPGNLDILGASPVVDYQNQLRIANTAYYQAPSGAYVFDAGSTWWVDALDEYSPRGAAQPNLLHGNQFALSLTLHMLLKMFRAGHVAAPSVPGVPEG